MSLLRHPMSLLPRFGLRGGVAVAATVAIAAVSVGTPSAAQGTTVLDKIADGTYEGTLSEFEFRDSVTVLDAAATLTKSGDTLSWSWSIEWEQALIECAYVDRDSWSGSEIEFLDDRSVAVSGQRVFEVDLSTTCNGPSGDVASVYDRSFGLELVGSELRGGIGVGQVSFAVDLADQATEYGVVERDGILFITSPPGETLEISRSDLPDWASWRIATVGAMSFGFGPVKSGDPNVLLDGLPIARLDDRTSTDATVINAAPDIFVNGRPAARIADYVRGILDSNVQITAFESPLITSGPCGGYEPDGTPELSEIYAACNPPVAAAVTQSDVSSGETVLDVDSRRFKAGDTIMLGSDETREEAEVSALGSLILSSPLRYDHPAGTIVISTDRVAGTTTSDSSGGTNLLLVGGLAAAAALLAAVFLQRRRGAA